LPQSQPENTVLAGRSGKNPNRSQKMQKSERPARTVFSGWDWGNNPNASQKTRFLVGVRASGQLISASDDFQHGRLFSSTIQTNYQLNYTALTQLFGTTILSFSMPYSTISPMHILRTKKLL
jgi:hypothetical protein